VFGGGLRHSLARTKGHSNAVTDSNVTVQEKVIAIADELICQLLIAVANRNRFGSKSETICLGRNAICTDAT
jgi:hypothetical protein